MPREPLWKGPTVDGISFSLLTDFLECRERFRLQVVEGLAEIEPFPEAMEYGSMFHAAEEAHRNRCPWIPAVKHYCLGLKSKYPEAAEAIEKWQQVCMVQFPLYLARWSTDRMEQERVPVCNEVKFRVPYTLPSGRTIVLRGKIDGVLIDLACRFDTDGDGNCQHHKNGCPLGLFVNENKTKGRVDEDALLATLFGDLQTEIYQLVLRLAYEKSNGTFLDFGDGQEFAIPTTGLDYVPEPAGVWYNVIRRPLGEFQKNSIKKKQSESVAQFYKRLADVIKENPDFFFMRWKTLISTEDMSTFCQHTLDPILEQLMDWWEYISVSPFDPWTPRIDFIRKELDGTVTTEKAILHSFSPEYDNIKGQNHIHWQSPWGVYNSLATGTRGSYFNYLTTGKRSNLTRIDSLFPELA